MNPELDFLITIAKQAGVMALKLQTEDLQIAYKGRADLVTKADKALEAYLLSEITGNSHPIASTRKKRESTVAACSTAGMWTQLMAPPTTLTACLSTAFPLAMPAKEN